MILDLEKFLLAGRPHWQALEARLDRLEGALPTATTTKPTPGGTPEGPANDRDFDLAAARELHRLYERASADLAKLSTFAAEPATRRYLEALVARGYAEIHAARGGTRTRFRPWHWVWVTFPQAFRRRLGAFWISLAVTFLGVAFGAGALLVDPESRQVTMAFGHGDTTPSQRVRAEQAAGGRRSEGGGQSFSGQLIRNNIRVSISAMAFGMTFGLGTLGALFYNGVILGAVACDYITDGQSVFLAGWLLPHGSIEIPAILIAGQAGLLLGHALLGRGSARPLAARLRALVPDLVTLIAGVALMLVWAGFIEAFFSQYHEPAVPYAVKIAFGLTELAAFALYLTFGGRNEPDPRR